MVQAELDDLPPQLSRRYLVDGAAPRAERATPDLTFSRFL
jgi:hypothetical protein